MELLFDIESTGLLRVGSQIHCIVIRNLADDDSNPLVFDTVNNNINEGVEMLEKAKTLVGHNIINYDLALLDEIYPDFKCPKRLRDTLIMSRLYFSTLSDRDFTTRPYGLPVKLYGRHSLKAWGIRLGQYKGDFAETNSWDTYSEAMKEYCIQDTLVTLELYRMLQKQEGQY
jgi:DNA polymerase I